MYSHVHVYIPRYNNCVHFTESISFVVDLPILYFCLFVIANIALNLTILHDLQVQKSVSNLIVLALI